MNTPLTDCLKEYIKHDFYPMHMPGHKRNMSFIDNPYSIDVTEIPELDDLHDASGVLKQSMEMSARIYGAKRTFYMVNGSSGGILAAICALDGAILVARNCHKSVYHGIALAGRECRYLFPERTKEGMCGSISSEAVKDMLEQMKEEGAPAKLVVITSPTYEGYVSDIAAIAAMCHEYGAYLMVDEAHGAHLPFMKSERFPKSALNLGADVVIQSLHKLLPSLTQTAILHVGKCVPEEVIEKIHYQLSVFQSSSPSYVLMSAIEQCIAYMDSEAGSLAVEHYEQLLVEFYENPKIKGLQSLSVLPMECQEKVQRTEIADKPVRRCGVTRDPSKIVIVSGTGAGCVIPGRELEEFLRLKYHIPMEMAAPDYVIGMTSVCDTREGLERLADALAEIDSEYNETMLNEDFRSRDRTDHGTAASYNREEEIGVGSVDKCMDIWDFGGYIGETKRRIREAMYAVEADYEIVEMKEAAGKVSGEFVYMYPPGIPFIIPGEMITREALKLIQGLDESRMKISGSSKVQQGKIRVLR